jgi:hypothetical protein
MQRLNRQTLEAVGNFAISFGDLDAIINDVAIVILECEELDVAMQLIADLTLGRKLELIGRVSEILAKEYKVSQELEALSEQLKSAKELVDNRNTVLHGSVTVRPGQHPIAETKKKKLTLTPS